MNNYKSTQSPVMRLATGLLLLDSYTERIVCWGDEDNNSGIVLHCERRNTETDVVLMSLGWRYCIFTKAYCFDTDN